MVIVAITGNNYTLEIIPIMSIGFLFFSTLSEIECGQHETPTIAIQSDKDKATNATTRDPHVHTYMIRIFAAFPRYAALPSVSKRTDDADHEIIIAYSQREEKNRES